MMIQTLRISVQVISREFCILGEGMNGMPQQQTMLGVLQLVALALPAFAILLELIVESDKSYTYYAVPVTTAGLGLFLLGGLFVLGELLVRTESAIFAMAIGGIGMGMLCLLVGAAAIGFQTQKEQYRTLDDDFEDP